MKHLTIKQFNRLMKPIKTRDKKFNRLREAWVRAQIQWVHNRKNYLEKRLIERGGYKNWSKKINEISALHNRLKRIPSNKIIKEGKTYKPIYLTKAESNKLRTILKNNRIIQFYKKIKIVLDKKQRNRYNTNSKKAKKEIQ